MKKLLKTYNFNSDMQYFEMILESFVNGQNTQARDQFKAMPKANRIQMVQSLVGNWDSGIKESNLVTLIGLI